jgi:hypothetical protein
LQWFDRTDPGTFQEDVTSRDITDTFDSIDKEKRDYERQTYLDSWYPVDGRTGQRLQARMC